jgi:hypothetical protein
MKYTLTCDSVQVPSLTQTNNFASLWEVVAEEERLTALTHWSGGRMWTNFRLVRNS